MSQAFEQNILPGKPYPLGANADEDGVNFALFSQHASGVELCLFESPSSSRESSRTELPARTGHVWHGYVPGLRPGQLYGFRVHGRYAPIHGHRFNPLKLLADPYAKGFGRAPRWHESLLGFRLSHKEDDDLSLSASDSAAYAPLSRVIHPDFTWANDRPPAVPWSKTVIYETHVKGSTYLHPKVPAQHRGTYLGLASEPFIEHLLALGVTAVELLPVFQGSEEDHLRRKGLSNYWGYNTLSYFAPDMRFCSKTPGALPETEFRSMVQALHAAGIEVILDVVYNHTCEGSQSGPTLCYRGADNASYYRLRPENPRFYRDYSGCGNTLNTEHPAVLQLIMDSLRYWVLEMHVDGFRFDLASALAREEHAFDAGAGFLDVIGQDPVVSQVKLIAEPWDVAEGGYQLANFPVNWAEWNDKYRATLRSFWRGDEGGVGRLASRIAGSSDLFALSGRAPQASINFVTCHDGFTLCDLVSYAAKHNEANGEENRDGENNNLSWNCGVEGPTKSAKVNALRQQQRRNLIASLLLSAGTPMLSGGDELSRTQLGNNNAYCQDNELNWYNWELKEGEKDFLHFLQQILKLRRSHPAFENTDFFTGKVSARTGLRDISWFTPEGVEFSDKDWNDFEAQTLGVMLSGEKAEADGKSADVMPLLILMNAASKAVKFRLPKGISGVWNLIVDTSLKPAFVEGKAAHSGVFYELAASSLTVLGLRLKGSKL